MDIKDKKSLSPVVAGVSVLVTCLFIVILVSLLIYFNAGNMGLKVINILRQNETTSFKDQIQKNKETETVKELEKQLKKRENEIAIKESKLDKSIDETEQLKRKLTGAFDNIESLIQLYSSMDPEKVAELLDLQDNISLKINVIKSLDPVFASNVLSNMKPEKAADLLEKIADTEVNG